MIGWCAVVFAGKSLAAELGGAAPRATDLLHAQRLATQARKRLELPLPGRAGWVAGGGGFGERHPPPAEDRPPEVHVHLGGGRQNKRKQNAP